MFMSVSLSRDPHTTMPPQIKSLLGFMFKKYNGSLIGTMFSYVVFFQIFLIESYFYGSKYTLS